MKQWYRPALLVALGCLCCTPLRADDPNGPAAPSKAQACLDRIKQLQGDWVYADGGEKGQPAATYRLTGGGTAVIETIFTGTPHEMTTVYHLDGDRLMMTHYCAAGNQPRMHADPTDGDRISFTCTGLSNAPEDAGHMHAMTMIFVDSDHLTHEWTWHAGGKGGPKTFNFERKK